jgi:predicted dehydrogenase
MDFEHGEVWWTSRGDGLDGRAAQESDEVWVRRDGRRRQIELPTVTRTDRAGSLTEFVTAIRDGREPETSGRDNLPSIGLTYAAVAAAASGLRTEV